jgi:rfaE bifunctional protein nucleotidyltransferase chain/domain
VSSERGHTHLAALAVSLRGLEPEAERAERWGRLLAGVLLRGGRLLAAGNGGSAAHAQHLAAELVGRYRTERQGLSAIALHAETSSLTAIANDYGFDMAFARQVAAHGRPGDVLLAISTSGGSPNVLAAVEAARSGGLTTWALTGPGPNDLADRCAAAVCVSADSTATVQEVHQVLVHVLCEAVDQAVAETDGTVAEKLVDWPALLARREDWRGLGRTVVWTNGVFDLLHVGHVRSLTAAKSFGDVLVVGVNDDQAVTIAKGAGRPLVPAAERAEVLAALDVVDAVVVFDEPTPERALEQLRPEVHCKGADYAPPDGKPIPEQALVESYGGRVEFLPLVEGRSTTELERRLEAVGDGG